MSRSFSWRARRDIAARRCSKSTPSRSPFVAEIWSPSTGDFDVETKFPEYRARGDAVIWRIHPFERTVTAWVRRADGGYDERALPLGRVAIESLPGVTIDLELLFEFV